MDNQKGHTNDGNRPKELSRRDQEDIEKRKQKSIHYMKMHLAAFTWLVMI